MGYEKRRGPKAASFSAQPLLGSDLNIVRVLFLDRIDGFRSGRRLDWRSGRNWPGVQSAAFADRCVAKAKGVYQVSLGVGE